DRVDVACHGERELGRVSATLGQVGRDVPESRQHSLDERDPMLVDRARKWIDDQRNVGHSWQPCHASTTSPSKRRIRTPRRRSTSVSSAPGSSGPKNILLWPTSATPAS